MSDNNHNHARRVTVSRQSRSASPTAGSESSSRIAVAVRRRDAAASPVTADEAPEAPAGGEVMDLLPTAAADAPSAEEIAEPAAAEAVIIEEPAAEASESDEPAEPAAQAENEAAPVPPEDIAGEADEVTAGSDDPAEDAAQPEAGEAPADDINEETAEVTSENDEPAAEITEPEAAEVPEAAVGEGTAEDASENSEPAEETAQPEAGNAAVCNAEVDIPDQAEETAVSDASLTDADTYPNEPATDEEQPAAPYVPEKWYIPQQWKDISILRKLIMGLAVCLFLFSCLPLFVGVISPGILPPVMIAAFFFCCALYWPLIDGCDTTWGNVLIAVVAVCVLAGVTYLSFVSGKMISASTNVLPEDRSDVTVVVLGCKINGDQPSRMLQARLETAADFLLEHPQSHCIVTGGQGSDEDYPEAFVMKNYLVDKGVSPMRIVMESTSTSTKENLANAAELAELYNCHERFLIVTDRFHQYRAMRAANDNGIVSYAENVETVWYLAMPYWFREMAAITRDWITD